jgi:anion-transporting  ArsA/GET3 family ATPase
VRLEHLCAASRVLIVAGKGGVGKTTVTAALAVATARTGASVLIVEVEGKSGLSTALGVEALEYAEVDVRPGVRARTLTPDQALLEYLEDRGLRRISRRLVRSGALDVVATAVPGMKDILVLGKVKQLERAGAADLIIIDAPAAGHAVTFLTSARALLDAVRVGPVRTQAQDVVELLSDATRCRVMLVTLPEETPVNELVDTAFALEDRAGVSLGPVVVNSFPGELAVAGHTLADDAGALGIGIPTPERLALDAATSFQLERYELALEQADRLAAAVPLPQIRLPFLFHEVGPAQVDQLADALTAEVEAIPEPGP